MQAIKLANTKDMSRDDWLKMRKSGIGGSDMAAIAGMNRWRSPLAVWKEKMGQADEQEENEKMYWGNQLEDLVAQEFAKVTGKKVKNCNYILQHPEHPFLLGNIDRDVVGEDAGLECKTAGEWAGKLLIKEEFLPEHFLQCQHYMAVTGYKKWYLACLIGGQKFVWNTLERDEEMIQNIIKIAGDFWDLVKTEVPPAPDGSESCSELIKGMYPVGNKAQMDLPFAINNQDTDDLINIILQGKETMKAVKAQVDEAQNLIKNEMKENEIGLYGGYAIKWNSHETSYFDKKQFKKDMPEVFAKYESKRPQRRFEIKEVN